MKKILFSLTLLLAASGMQAQETEYVITGTVPDSVKTVRYFLNSDYRKMDSVKVAGGKFQLNSKAPLNTFITLVSGRERTTVVNDRTPITVNFKNDKVTGSAVNVQFTDFQKSQKKLVEKYRKLYMDYAPVAKDKTIEGTTKAKTLEKQMDELSDKMKNNIASYVKTHRNDVTPAYFLGTEYYSFDYDELNTMLDSSAAYYNHPMTDAAKNQLASLAKRRPGLQFTDLTMQDLNGKTVKLSQWAGKGNYVLVDFWASWCGPCRAEMPNVVDAYKRYHQAKNFDIVGVSFDYKGDPWKKAVKDLGMEWHQMSDLQGWKCAAHDAYGVNAIPSNVLLDPNGKIVAADLRGEGLANKLKEIFGY